MLSDAKEKIIIIKIRVRHNNQTLRSSCIKVMCTRDWGDFWWNTQLFYDLKNHLVLIQLLRSRVPLTMKTNILVKNFTAKLITEVKKNTLAKFPFKRDSITSLGLDTFTKIVKKVLMILKNEFFKPPLCWKLGHSTFVQSIM